MEKYYTYRMNVILLNVLAIILFIVVSIISFLFIDELVIDLSINIFIYMVILMILHELLHAIGFGINKEVSFKNIVLGMCLEKGIFYCMCKQEISKRSILVALLFPLFFIGILTLIIGIVINSSLLIILSIINISGAIGDIMMTLFIISLPKDIKYLDLDDMTSFTLISKEDLSGKKIIGLELFKTGIYDKEVMYASNNQRIVISKTSKVFLFIIVGMFILSLLF